MAATTTQRAIRDAVYQRLVTILDQEHVWKCPRWDLPDGHLPALCVFSASDTPADAEADTQEIHERDYTLRVVIQVNERTEDDATDLLADSVRAAILRAEWLGDAMSVRWTSQTWDGVEGGDPLSGTALDFTFRYTYDPNPEA